VYLKFSGFCLFSVGGCGVMRGCWWPVWGGLVVVHLSPSLQHFLKTVIGMEWPEGDEGDVEDCADAAHRYSQKLKDAAAAFRAYAVALRDSMGGEAADQLFHYYHNQVPGNLEQMAESAEEPVTIFV
jgi:hypothetical protein